MTQTPQPGLRVADTLQATFGLDTRVRVISPVPGGEIAVGDVGTVVAAWRRARICMKWDKDGKLRNVHRKRLEIIQPEQEN